MLDDHDVKNRKLLEKQRVQNRFAFYEVHIDHFLFYIVNATLQLLFAAMTECRDLAIFVLTNGPRPNSQRSEGIYDRYIFY